MLQISALHSHYGLSHVIQGIDLSAAPGEGVDIGRARLAAGLLVAAFVRGWTAVVPAEPWPAASRGSAWPNTERTALAGAPSAPELFQNIMMYSTPKAASGGTIIHMTPPVYGGPPGKKGPAGDTPPGLFRAGSAESGMAVPGPPKRKRAPGGALSLGRDRLRD